MDLPTAWGQALHGADNRQGAVGYSAWTPSQMACIASTFADQFTAP